MSQRYRCLMLGAGAMGSRWIREIWQPFRDQMEFAGLVDPNPAALREAGGGSPILAPGNDPVARQ